LALIEFNRDPTPRQVRHFALFWFSGFCCMLAAIVYYRYDARLVAVALLACAAASVVIGCVRPAWMRGVLLGWSAAAYPFGWLVSHVLMAAVYYLLIAPIGVAMRLFGRDPLSRRFDRDAKTYLTTRSATTDPVRYFRQY